MCHQIRITHAQCKGDAEGQEHDVRSDSSPWYIHTYTQKECILSNNQEVAAGGEALQITLASMW